MGATQLHAVSYYGQALVEGKSWPPCWARRSSTARLIIRFKG